MLKQGEMPAYIINRCGSIKYSKATSGRTQAIKDTDNNANAWKALLAERIYEKLKGDFVTLTLEHVQQWLKYAEANWREQTVETGSYQCVVWYLNRLTKQ